MAASPDTAPDGRARTDAEDPRVVLIPVRDAWGRPADFRYEEINPPAAEWIGLPTGLVLGRTLKEVFSPAELAPILPRLRTLCETGEAWVEDDLLDVDGSRRLALRAEIDEERVALTFRRVGAADGDRPGVPPEVGAVARMAAAIAADLSQDEVYRLLTELLADLYGAGSVAIGRLGDGGEVRVLRTGLDGVDTLVPGGLPLAVTLATGRPARCDDHGGIRDPVAAQLLARGLRATIAAPMILGGTTVGGIAMATPGPAPARAEPTLAVMATLVGILLRDVDRDLAAPPTRGVDALTGLPGHAEFRHRLARAWEGALADGAPLALAVFDIDRLASINQASGHRIGDAVLATVAERLRSVCGDGDVARIGGEQFAWIMPGCDAQTAISRAGRLRREVSARPIAGAGVVTVSGGVAEMAQASRPAEMLRLAEGALSWAKTHGRDLVLGFDPDVVAAFSAAEWAERIERESLLASVEALARVVDAKDRSTHEHSERVGAAAARVAAELGWPDAGIARLRIAGRVHDVGKIAIPDDIIAKPARLTAAEYARVKDHAVRGAEIVDGVLSEEEVAWVRHHHERWDGSGYPDGLAGEEIPVGARILALVDAFDVMLSTRPYSPGLPLAGALEECRRCSGTQFWPAAVDALVRVYRAVPPSG